MLNMMLLLALVVSLLLLCGVDAALPRTEDDTLPAYFLTQNIAGWKSTLLVRTYSELLFHERTRTGAWSLEQTISGIGTIPGSHQGSYMAMGDDIAVIAEKEARVVVYRRASEDGVWYQDQVIAGPSEFVFGYSIAVSATTLAVGAPWAYEPVTYRHAGRVYLYEYSDESGTYVEQDQTLSGLDFDLLFDGYAPGRVGRSLALHEDLLVTGAYGSYTESGVFVYRKDAATGLYEPHTANTIPAPIDSTVVVDDRYIYASAHVNPARVFSSMPPFGPVRTLEGSRVAASGGVVLAMDVYGGPSVIVYEYNKDTLQLEERESLLPSVSVYDPIRSPQRSQVAVLDDAYVLFSHEAQRIYTYNRERVHDPDEPLIERFILFNATEDPATSRVEKRLAFLDGEEVFSLSEVGTELSVRVQVDGPVESVVFGLNGSTNYRTENEMPFMLGGDFPRWNLIAVPELSQPGTFVVSATPYDQDDGQGVSGSTKTVKFHLID